MEVKPNGRFPLVLVVDDDDATREMFSVFLEGAGFTTVLVSSGTAAIEEARRLIPDVIVTDVMMPGAGGLQTLFVLKNMPETAHIPTLVVSGISPRILDLMPATAYLEKPVDRQEFVTAVRECLARAKA